MENDATINMYRDERGMYKKSNDRSDAAHLRPNPSAIYTANQSIRRSGRRYTGARVCTGVRHKNEYATSTATAKGWGMRGA